VPKVRDGEVDIAIAARPDKLPAGVQFQDFAEAPLRLIAPKLACPVRSAILENPVDWAGVPFILAEHGIARDRVMQWFRQQSVKPHIHAQVSGHEAIVSMVALGFGVGAVPQPVLDHSPLADQIHVIPDQAPFAPFTVGICARARYLSDPRLAAFWQMALVVYQRAE
jgi:LysR family positive regulator for ilvC